MAFFAAGSLASAPSNLATFFGFGTVPFACEKLKLFAFIFAFHADSMRIVCTSFG